MCLHTPERCLAFHSLGGEGSNPETTLFVSIFYLPILSCPGHKCNLPMSDKRKRCMVSIKHLEPLEAWYGSS